MTAFTLYRENGLQVIVFDMDTRGNLEKGARRRGRSAQWSNFLKTYLISISL